MTRLEKAAHARELRDQGLLLREIGERMGAARSTVHAWLSDPDGSQLQARKDSYRGSCIDCGAPTDGSNGPAKAPERCRQCHSPVWTREAILLAIQEWADDHGGIPPTLSEMGGTHAAVARHFGKWNNALREAGFDLKCDRRPETQAAIEAAIRAGEPTSQIADRFGCTRENIHMRMRTRGLRVSDLREAA